MVTRRSLSVTKPKKELNRRSCLSAIPNKKRSQINKWKSSSVLNVKTDVPSTSGQVQNLANFVRKSLFLKNKNETSNSSISLNKSTRKSVVMNFEPIKTPSPRGVKRLRSCSTGRVTKKAKREGQVFFLDLF